MIDQKQMIQLIGEWGYTPSELEKYVNKQGERAKVMGETVGMTTYSSLISMCRYAETGDYNQAIIAKDNKFAFVNKIIPTEIKNLIEGDDFSEKVIDSLYDICSKHKKYREAEIAIRKQVIMVVAPLLLTKIVELGNEVAENIMEYYIGADHVQQTTSGYPQEFLKGSDIKIAKLILQIKKYTNDILDCTKTENDSFNEMSISLFGDIEDIVIEVNENVLSIIGKPPHVWASYAVSFGRMVVGFMIAMSMGHITYDEYDEIVSDFNDVMDKSKISFGRN